MTILRTSLRCLLCLLRYKVVSLSWFCDHRACISGRKNRHGHWVCCMSTGRKNGTHTQRLFLFIYSWLIKFGCQTSSPWVYVPGGDTVLYLLQFDGALLFFVFFSGGRVQTFCRLGVDFSVVFTAWPSPDKTVDGPRTFREFSRAVGVRG